MAALKIVSKCGGAKWQTVCKLRFLLRAPALRPLGASRAVQFAPDKLVVDFCLAITTKSSGTILNDSPEGVRHRDMPNKNLHRAKLSNSIFVK